MLQEKRCILISLFIVFIYLLPLLVYEKDAVIQTHDELDSIVADLKVISDSGKFFAAPDTPIESAMNGLPRASFPPSTYLLPWLYYCLGDFPAYVVNQFIIHFLAFIGMYLFLKRYVLRESGSCLICCGVGLIYSLLPFYPFFGIAIAGMPLLLYSFLNIRDTRDNWFDWIVILLSPINSFFPSVGVFLFAGLVVLLAIDVIVLRKRSRRLAVALFAHLAVNLAMNYGVIQSLIVGDGLESHRVERSIYSHKALGAVLRDSLDLFLQGQYHAQSVHYGFLAVILLAVLWGLATKERSREFIILSGILAVLFAISLVFGFQSWEKFDFLKSRFTFFRTFQLGRFYTLSPLLWYSGLACALFLINAKLPKVGRYIVFAVVLFQITVLFKQSNTFYPARVALKNFLRGGSGQVVLDVPTYREFYSERLFSEIKKYIGRPPSTYRVVSIGLFPSIAQYNGFYTLDGYYGNYPLEYKHKFRKVIARELAKSDLLKAYFDDWGNRAYVFSSELGRNFLFGKQSGRTIKELSLDPDALRDIGCDYLLSSVLIENAQENRLSLLKVFDDSESWWRIHLYKVN